MVCLSWASVEATLLEVDPHQYLHKHVHENQIAGIESTIIMSERMIKFVAGENERFGFMGNGKTACDASSGPAYLYIIISK